MNDNQASQKQLEYVRRCLMKKRMIYLSRILIFVGFIGIWECSVRLGALNDFIFSSPARILRSFLKMCGNGEIFVHTGITVGETLLSFCLVIIIALITAVLLWMSNTLFHILEPFLVILNSLPKSALAPVLIVWLGNNPKTIVVTAISVAIFGTIINLYTSFHEIDPEKVKLIKMLGGTRLDVLYRLILPSSLPIIMSNAKVNIGLCLVGVIIGEFLAARKGLGYLIIYGSQTMKMDWVIMSIAILCCIAGLLYWAIAKLEKRIS